MRLIMYLVIYNIAVLLIYGADKLFAKLKTRRTPEKVLITLAILGGACGALTGMVLFHHKISKPLFRYLVTALFIIQAGIYLWLEHSGYIIV